MRLLFRLIALAGIMAAAVFVGRGLLPSVDRGAATATPEIQVRIASRSLPAGTFLDEPEAPFTVWHEPVSPEMVANPVASGHDVIGAVIIAPITAGQPILRSQLLLPGQDGFLAAVLHVGMRAVSVAVDAVSGNRVDLILTQTLNARDPSARSNERWASETILRDVRVIAVDQSLRADMTQHGPRLSVLTAEQPLDTDMPMADKAVEALIQTLERQFHYVIIDLPRLPGSLYAYILRRAGVRVLVADRTVPGVRDLTRMLGLMDDTAGRSILVLNDSRPQSEGLAERTMIEDTIGRPFDVRLAYDKAMSRVVDNLGEPLASVGGVFADGVRELTNVLSGQHGKRRKGWLQLVRGR